MKTAVVSSYEFRDRSKRRRAFQTTTHNKNNNNHKNKKPPCGDGAGLEVLVHAATQARTHQCASPKPQPPSSLPIRYMACLQEELTGRFLGYVALVPCKDMRGSSAALSGVELRVHKVVPFPPAVAASPSPLYSHLHCQSPSASPNMVPSTPGATPASRCDTPTH